MTHGIDTDFLVAIEIRDHIFHRQADALMTRLLDEEHTFALAPQTLAEFLHVVTDPRRMQIPLPMDDAITRAGQWWQAEEVVRIYPDGEAAGTFLDWLRKHRLGRKRLLDTLLAAAYFRNGVRRIITNNDADFSVFGVFEIIAYREQ